MKQPRAVHLVQFRADEIEPRLQSRTRERAGRRGKAAFGFLIGQVLHDGWALGQQLAVVEFEHRHIAVRIHGGEVRARRRRMRRFAEVDAHQFERDSSFNGNDMRR
jgi:hypothetical protein